jgi:Mg-chelatase subunit ChlD
MAGRKLEQVKNAARSVHQALEDKDRLAIISFDTKPFWRLKPRPNGQIKRQGELENILDRMTAQGSTALYGAIVMRRKEQKTRIIFLTDGRDTLSRRYHQDILSWLPSFERTVNLPKHI